METYLVKIDKSKVISFVMYLLKFYCIQETIIGYATTTTMKIEMSKIVSISINIFIRV